MESPTNLLTLKKNCDSMDNYTIISPAEYVKAVGIRQESYSDRVVEEVLKGIKLALSTGSHSCLSNSLVSFTITVWHSAGKNEETKLNNILTPQGWEAELISNSRSMANPQSTWRVTGKVAEQA